MTYLLDIDGYLVDGNEHMPFRVQITHAQATEGGDHYVATISIPTLFSQPREMRGQSREDAESTAIAFVDELIGDRQVVDRDGQPFLPEQLFG